MNILNRIILVIITTLTSLAWTDVQTLVIDTGPGLATVTRMDNGDIFVYDTGHWNTQSAVFQTMKDFIGNNDIDLLVLSHIDSDHIAATDELFAEFRVQRVIRTGLIRSSPTATWKRANKAIEEAAKAGLTHDINLAKVNFQHGTTFQYGASTITILSGFHKPPDDWGLSGSEYYNGNSIVVRLEYAGNSILFTGDAVGRDEKENDPESPSIATEKYLIDNSQNRPISSNIMFAPHHGGNDASSSDFIREVAPQWVIFSAGHDHEHPRQETADRYLRLGYSPECLLRTDMGDNEDPGKEWDYGRSTQRDSSGDDNITIELPSSGKKPIVSYEGANKINCQILPYR